MNLVLLLSCLITGGMETYSIPYTPGTDTPLLVRVWDDGVTDIALLSPGKVTLYNNCLDQPTCVVNLPEGVSALDFVDIDQDANMELLVVQGKRLLAFSLPRDALTSPEGRVLFESENRLNTEVERAFPYVLGVFYEESWRIAWPTETQLELRTPSGAVVKRFSIDKSAPRRATYGHPFKRTLRYPSQCAPQDAVAFHIDRVEAFEPYLPEDMLPITTTAALFQRRPLRQVLDASGRPPRQWPWFSLTGNTDTLHKVHYALDSDASLTTLIALEEIPKTGAPIKQEKELPKRRYPGVAYFPEEALADFNGDGFVDLLLWNPDTPVVSFGGMSKALTNNAWPLHVTTHLFVPEKKRYAPLSMGRISLSLPLHWLLYNEARNPLRWGVLEDMNGDGLTDFACGLDENSYAIWFWEKDKGFSSAPQFTFRSPAPFQVKRFSTWLDKQKTFAVALTTADAVHCIHITAEE